MPETSSVDIEDAPATVRAGQPLSVTAGVQHDGETEVTLTVDGEGVVSETVEAADGERETVTLEWTPEPDAVGTVEISVETADDSATETVTVEDAPAEFTIDITYADEYAAGGGTATVIGTITNEGTLSGTQTVDFRVDDESRETMTLTLDGQESERFEFTTEVADDDLPELTLTVVTEDDEEATAVPVLARTVSTIRDMGSKSGMGLFGWLVFVGMVIILLPLLPILALIKLFDLLFGRTGSAT